MKRTLIFSARYLAGQMFDDELELAYTVINGAQARGEKGNYSTQRVKFNSNLASKYFDTYL